MNIKKICILIFVTGLTLCMSAKSNGQNTFSVAGIVVDDEGNPLENAAVSMHFPPCDTCFDHIIPSNKTGKDGFFSFDVVLDLQQVELVIAGPVPDGLWTPGSTTGLSDFQGIKLNPSIPGEFVELVRVLPHIQFKAVSIDLLKLFNVDEVSLGNNSLLTISIDYKGEKIVDDLWVHERAIDKRNNKVNFALPKGKWEVIFEISNKNRKRVGSVLVDLESENEPLYKYHNNCN